MKDLSSCKFCEEKENIKIRETGVCWVECEVCHCRGPVAVFRTDAVDYWNGNFKSRDNKEVEKDK